MVGRLGQRSIYIPLGIIFVSNWTSCFLSVTEDEIERSILKAKDCNKHRHCFKRDITDMYNNADDMKKLGILWIKLVKI